MAKGIAVGINKGFITEKLNRKQEAKKPSYRKGKLGKRVKFIRNIIREVCGFAPYEKRLIELLKTDLAKDQKKALKLAKRRLGTHKRGKRKRHEMEEVIKAQRRREK